MILAFTGHRPTKLGGWKEPNPVKRLVKAELVRLLMELKPEHVVSGMALGVDQWAAEIAFDLGIPFLAAVPCDDQDHIWKPEAQTRYRELLAKAMHVVVVSPGPYARWKMPERNHWMVDHCDKLIAVWDGSPGGTSECVSYAKRRGKPIIMVVPRELLDRVTKEP